jgi:hypothetical protein
MKNHIKVLTGLAICVSVTAAYANGDIQTSYAKPGFVVGLEGGWGNLNTPDPVYPRGFILPFDTATVYFNKDHDIGDFMWGAHVGYDFQTGSNSLVGVELGYKDLGRSKYSSNLGINFDEDSSIDFATDFSRKIDQQAVDLLLSYHYFVYQGFNVFAKAGVADVYSKTRQNLSVSLDTDDTTFNNIRIPAAIFNGEISALSGSKSIWRLEPEVQLGAGYMFAQHVNVYAFYDHIGDTDSSVGDHLTQAKVYNSNSVWAGISYTF